MARDSCLARVGAGVAVGGAVGGAVDNPSKLNGFLGQRLTQLAEWLSAYARQ
ncbi:hypothetical protein FH972_009842 [Carpinus fangiana]|uniref:Uncharacterized protein n=1 Tax=Carpinus fangiana TaxID=176857 RepID=A0A660KN44_9ROSI|nr:hypothetical protein FH972_009842 [Carpinus fangiana]